MGDTGDEVVYCRNKVLEEVRGVGSRGLWEKCPWTAAGDHSSTGTIGKADKTRMDPHRVLDLFKTRQGKFYFLSEM